MKKKQLIEYFQVYRNAFPDWTAEQDAILSRVHGPLKQRIGFEALGSGAYRPSTSIEVLPVPDYCYILGQRLDVKHREVFPREHSTKWPLVIKAMEEQFVPSIRKPLDVAEALRLGEEKQARDHIDRIYMFAALAALNAYVGNNQRALYWCGRAEEASSKPDSKLTEWECHQTHFTGELRQAIEAGNEREFLPVA